MCDSPELSTDKRNRRRKLPKCSALAEANNQRTVQSKRTVCIKYCISSNKVGDPDCRMPE